MTETKVYTAISQSATNTARIFDLCERGRIHEAQALLVESDDPEMLLARGVVEYWLARIGTKVSIEDAKNRLTKAEAAGADPYRCQVFLGLCYWRQGCDTTARIMFDHAEQSPAPHTKYLALLARTQIQCEQGRWREAFKTLDSMAALVDKESDCNKGKFFNQRANANYHAFHELGEDYRDRSFADYKTAIHFFDLSGSLRHKGTTLNNLAFLYRAIDPPQAHRYVDEAIVLFSRIDDRSSLGSAKDTKAQIYLRTDNLREALVCANDSIRLLTAIDDEVWLPTSYATRAMIYGLMRETEKAAEDSTRAAGSEETKRISRALDYAKGKVTVAARELGMSHSTLIKIINQHPELKLLRKKPRVRHKSIIKK